MTQELEFNSAKGVEIAQKAVKNAKTRDEVIALFAQRPGNVGHKVIVDLLMGREVRALKSKE
jgi:hypothetical protein